MALLFLAIFTGKLWQNDIGMVRIVGLWSRVGQLKSRFLLVFPEIHDGGFWNVVLVFSTALRTHPDRALLWDQLCQEQPRDLMIVSGSQLD